MKLATGRLCATLVVLCFTAGFSPAQAGGVYWSTTEHPAGVWAANLDGSNPQVVVRGYTSGIAIDPVARKLYWGEYTDDSMGAVLRRANLDGSNPRGLHVLGGAQPVALTLDREAGWIYMAANFFEGCIGILRYRMSGAGDQEDVVLGICAGGVAVDSAAGKLYWAQQSPDPSIRRSNLDGSGIEVLLEPPTPPVALALDAPRGKLYWTQLYGDGVVLRANTDGSDLETVVPGEEYAAGVALDLRADKLYWGLWVTEQGINRSDLDGSNPETILEVRSWGQIAIDSTPGPVDVPAASVTGLVLLLLAMMWVSARVIRKSE